MPGQYQSIQKSECVWDFKGLSKVWIRVTSWISVKSSEWRPSPPYGRIQDRIAVNDHGLTSKVKLIQEHWFASPCIKHIGVQSGPAQIWNISKEASKLMHPCKGLKKADLKVRASMYVQAEHIQPSRSWILCPPQGSFL